MNKKTRLKIGEFSKLMQVTVKTLRHYEQKRLLIPDEVDEWTGYRYYSIEQMQKLQNIRDLQRLGFSLDEIKELCDSYSCTPTISQLTEKIEETEAQLRKLIARRNQLIDWRNARKQMKKMEKFSIQSLPEIIVASHREVLPNYAAIGPMCINKIAPEMQRLGCKCPPPGYCLGPLHEACRPLRTLLRVVRRGLPLHRRTRPEACRPTSHVLHRRGLESGRPREMALRDSDSNRVIIRPDRPIWLGRSGCNTVTQ